MSDPNRPLERELEASVTDFELGAVGDCIVTRPLARQPEFAGALAALGGCDALYGNLETVIFDLRTFAGSAYPFASDWPLASPPAVAADLAAIGVGLVGRANNHALDWGLEAMRESSGWLDRAGIAHAGTGENAGLARAPAYLETTAGRVGLVSCTTTYRETSEAAPARGAAPSRPGLAGIKLTRTLRLPPEPLRLAEQLRTALGPRLAGEADAGPLLLGHRFESIASETPSYAYSMDSEDLAATLRAVRLGKQHSDLLVAALHAHEPRHDEFPQPPGEFVGEFGRAAIDAGADVVVTTGIHHLAGVELYRGRPIFHGLGNFVFSDIVEPLPHELYVYARDRIAHSSLDPEQMTDADLTNLINGQWFANAETFHGALARCRWRAGTLTTVELHPLDLGYGRPLTTSGVPVPAAGAVADTIIERLAALSADLGTTVTPKRRGGATIGVIDVTEADR
jgi:poly-gamma-glutamate capsule biosynthesis protein CapA/YwtB (metallophosphatase superfamily)